MIERIDGDLSVESNYDERMRMLEEKDALHEVFQRLKSRNKKLSLAAGSLAIGPLAAYVGAAISAPYLQKQGINRELAYGAGIEYVDVFIILGILGLKDRINKSTDSVIDKSREIVAGLGMLPESWMSRE